MYLSPLKEESHTHTFLAYSKDVSCMASGDMNTALWNTTRRVEAKRLVIRR